MQNMTEKEKSSIFHKVDMRLVPMLALLYLIAHLDRASGHLRSVEPLMAY